MTSLDVTFDFDVKLKAQKKSLGEYSVSDISTMYLRGEGDRCIMRHCEELLFVLFVTSDVYLLAPSISNSPDSCQAKELSLRPERFGPT